MCYTSSIKDEASVLSPSINIETEQSCWLSSSIATSKINADFQVWIYENHIRSAQETNNL